MQRLGGRRVWGESGTQRASSIFFRFAQTRSAGHHEDRFSIAIASTTSFTGSRNNMLVAWADDDADDASKRASGC